MKIENDQTEYFDRLAPSWDDCYAQSRMFQERYRVFQNAVKQYASTRHRALDFGCGSGVLTKILEELFASVVATDLSPNMLDHTRQKYKDSPNVDVVSIGDVPEGDFDFLICSSVIEYVDDPNEFVGQLSGYLRPGGTMAVTFSNKNGLMQMYNRYIAALFRSDSYTKYQKNSHTGRDIRRLIEPHGLVCLELSTPLGLPVVTAFGLGDLHMLVARKP